MSGPVEYLRAREVGRYLGVSTRTVWRWSVEGRIPAPVHLSRKVTRWALSEVMAAVAKLRRGA